MKMMKAISLNDVANSDVAKQKIRKPLGSAEP